VRRLTLAAAIVMSIVLVSTAFAEGSKEGASTGPVNMRFMWWGSDVRHKATLAVIDQFMAKNPNVKIEAEYGGFDGYLQKLTTQLSGGTAPDLIQIDVPWLYAFSQQGDLFVDLYKAMDTSMFDKGALKKGEVRGKLWGVPTGVLCEETFGFNVDFFKRFGIDPKTEWNWDNLMSIGTEVHRKDPKSYLMTSQADFPEFFMVYMLQLTGNANMVNADYTVAFTEDQARDMFTYLKRGMDAGVFMPLDLVVPNQPTQESAMWQKGLVGMTILPTSTITAYVKASPFEFGGALLPLRPGTKNSGFEIRPSQILSVNARSKAIPQTLDFIKFFFTDETAVLTLADTRGVPASEFGRSLLLKNNKLSPVMREVTDKANRNPGLELIPLHHDEELFKIVEDLVGGVAYGKMTPDQAAAALVRQYTDKLAELKSRAR
jgi:oligogalacturonide transport system substrate-binding protein